MDIPTSVTETDPGLCHSRRSNMSGRAGPRMPDEEQVLEPAIPRPVAALLFDKAMRIPSVVLKQTGKESLSQSRWRSTSDSGMLRSDVPPGRRASGRSLSPGSPSETWFSGTTKRGAGPPLRFLSVWGFFFFGRCTISSLPGEGFSSHRSCPTRLTIPGPEHVGCGPRTRRRPVTLHQQSCTNS